MIQHDRILLVPVPVGASNIHLEGRHLWFIDVTWRLITLPQKGFLHGLFPTLSEDVCKGFDKPVDYIEDGNFKQYLWVDHQDGDNCFDTAKESLFSLILHYGYDPEGCVVVE